MTDDGSLDQLHIAELRFTCVVGVNPHEQREAQEVAAHVTLYADLSAACRSDCLTDTVDYKAVKLDILAAVRGKRFNLIEHLAQRMADVCLAHEPVKRVTVTLEKPGALTGARSVWVRITRGTEKAGT